MKALSIRQPWAWLICAGFKDIENREWGTKFRGRIYVHTGKSFDFDGFNYVCLNTHKLIVPARWDIEEWARLAVYPTLGAIIGEVDITGCVTESSSPWFVGKYGLLLANPILYAKPIPYKGRLGFFDVPDEIMKETEGKRAGK